MKPLPEATARKVQSGCLQVLELEWGEGRGWVKDRCDLLPASGRDLIFNSLSLYDFETEGKQPQCGECCRGGVGRKMLSLEWGVRRKIFPEEAGHTSEGPELNLPVSVAHASAVLQTVLRPRAVAVNEDAWGAHAIFPAACKQLPLLCSLISQGAL